MEKVTIDGVELNLIQPDEVPMTWVGQEELVTQVLAAWIVIGDDDLPLNPRLIGKPGVGKTTLAYHSGRTLNRPVYIFQATMDTRPEDLIVTPVISEAGKVKYMASSVVSAMVKGGIAIIDEGNHCRLEQCDRKIKIIEVQQDAQLCIYAPRYLKLGDENSATTSTLDGELRFKGVIPNNFPPHLIIHSGGVTITGAGTITAAGDACEPGELWSC